MNNASLKSSIQKTKTKLIRAAMNAPFPIKKVAKKKQLMYNIIEQQTNEPRSRRKLQKPQMRVVGRKVARDRIILFAKKEEKEHC